MHLLTAVIQTPRMAFLFLFALLIASCSSDDGQNVDTTTCSPVALGPYCIESLSGYEIRHIHAVEYVAFDVRAGDDQIALIFLGQLKWDRGLGQSLCTSGKTGREELTVLDINIWNEEDCIGEFLLVTKDYYEGELTIRRLNE